MCRGFVLKTSSVGTVLSSNGRLVHRVGPVWEKDLSPQVFSLVLGMVSKRTIVRACLIFSLVLGMVSRRTIVCACLISFDTCISHITCLTSDSFDSIQSYHDIVSVPCVL